MSQYVVDIQEIGLEQVAVAGGKGARLGELARIPGLRVPPGFCVTTAAFTRVVQGDPGIRARLDGLDRLGPDDAAAIREHSADVRRAIEDAAIPADLATAVERSLARHGADAAYAVRSSATAEDSEGASFAGQHDSYLHVAGRESLLRHVARCWASAFTERAVSYRLRRGVDHGQAQMAVVVQRMVVPHAAGVLFTADPVTSNRRVSCVEAVLGLGDALVSGQVDPDVFKVRDDRLVTAAVATKRVAVRASPSGGTRDEPVAADRQERPALTDAQVVELVRLGRRIEAHFGAPQDVEWCLGSGGFAIVQSRPITTLFPVPEAGDDEPHVYVSVGHQQMMTDPMRPLGLSLFQLTAMPRMYEAAGRLFVDVAPRLASPDSRAAVIDALGTSDPLIGDALRSVVDRGGLVPDAPAGGFAGPPPGGPPATGEPDPAVIGELVAATEASLAVLEREIRTHSGAALVDFVVADLAEGRERLFDPRSMPLIMAAMDASIWLNARMAEWLGETNAADVLTQSAPGNITSEMGLELLDVADAIRPHPEVVALLERVRDGDDAFLDELADVPGGPGARERIEAYLDRYGVRCVGEIDITRPRWRERPSTLVPLLVANVRNFAPGESRRRFQRGRQEAAAKERDLLERLRALPDGAQKAAETQRMIDRVRTFSGYREYPKFGLISRYALYKRALLEEAERQVDAGVLRERDDVFFLTMQELGEALRTGEVDDELLTERRRAFRSYGALTPPRVLTSEGEVFGGDYRRDDVPDGALVGLAVSGGTVEGRARVVLDMTDASLEAGDVLVTAFTDPSWSPLFVTAAALVTEVGGLMTHGAVVAREYGLPAVVGVEGATRRIRDGQRVRVHGTDGFVELLD
ncbi:rifamycin-inactivating phosphotransferase [Patulibacter sp. NPDC049589]|uniref:rifamycin-inactivating phosphotransferase n=1 Tax=Patulibacter sp. NPDC049589 TaxID=3154731 RepID=UPI00342AB71E